MDRMKHIDAYLHLTYLKTQFGWQNRTVEYILYHERKFHEWQTLDKIQKSFDEFPPTTTQIVQALDRMGVSPNNIASYLEITKQSVSYHRSRKNHPKYYNKYFEEFTTTGASLPKPKRRRKQEPRGTVIYSPY